MAYYSYQLTIDDSTFGLIFSQIPIIHSPVQKEDKIIWGRFNIIQRQKQDISFLQKRKLYTITKSIFDSFHLDLSDFPIYLCPSSDSTINLDYAEAESNFIMSYSQTLGIDFSLLYPLPSHPNHPDEETHKLFLSNCRLQEAHQNLESCTLKSLRRLCHKYYDQVDANFSSESVFPTLSLSSTHEELNGTAISFMKFLSYFYQCFSKIASIYSIHRQLKMSPEDFPHLIQAFTVEFIPGLCGEHNPIEKVGDAALSLIVIPSLVKALAKYPIHYLNKRYNNAISNEFFNVMCTQMRFQDAIVGPIDEEKVPADCFEAIAGFIYAYHSFEDVIQFWKQVIFLIPSEYIETNHLTKTVECMKLGLQLNTIDQTVQTSFPPFVQPYIKGLNPPLALAFDSTNDYQQKCKMVGAAVLKALVALFCYKTDRPMKLIELTVKKDTLNETIPKIGFPSPRIFKAFLGSIYLTNDYSSIENMVNQLIIPQLHIPTHLKPPRPHR